MRGPGSGRATDAPPAGGAPAQRSGGSASDARNDRLRDDVAHLLALVDALPGDRGPMSDRAPRPRPVPDDHDRHAGALRLRGIVALLMTLDADLRTRPTAGAARRSDVAPGPAADGGAGRGAGQGGAGPGPELAAAAASYIARDLAARRLTEFTSAEAYRLARALAAVGGVADRVERTLAEANTIRLHPAPLDRAVSHSAG